MTDLGPTGKAFAEQLTDALVKHKQAMAPLIVEAARAVDRLGDLDDIIAGKDVLALLRFRLCDEEGHVAEVKFDSVLAEARQQQSNLAGLMKVIVPNLNEAAGVAKERDPLDEIAERRASRRSGATTRKGGSKRSS